jgi:hypothetical protein
MCFGTGMSRNPGCPSGGICHERCSLSLSLSLRVQCVCAPPRAATGRAAPRAPCARCPAEGTRGSARRERVCRVCGRGGGLLVPSPACSLPLPCAELCMQASNACGLTPQVTVAHCPLAHSHAEPCTRAMRCATSSSSWLSCLSPSAPACEWPPRIHQQGPWPQPRRPR